MAHALWPPPTRFESTRSQRDVPGAVGWAHGTREVYALDLGDTFAFPDNSHLPVHAPSPGETWRFVGEVQAGPSYGSGAHLPPEAQGKAVCTYRLLDGADHVLCLDVPAGVLGRLRLGPGTVVVLRDAMNKWHRGKVAWFHVTGLETVEVASFP